MPSRKGKEAKKARREKRKQRSQRGSSGGIEPGSFGTPGLVFEPAGREKMSVVLEEFAEPYREESGFESDDDYRELLELAVLAWNAALLPEDEQQEWVDKFVAELAGGNADSRAELRSLLNAMLDRKKTCFPHNRRGIMGFELTNTGEGFHLTVVSTL